jgi:DNA-directed RNA polymerase specialized sigma24 family protein
VLNGRLELHDIRCVESYCAHIIQRSRLNLNPHDHEDLLTWLIESTWHLSTTYRPGGRSFSAYAGTRLPQRLIDWQRQRKDTRYPSNTKYTTISIDGAHGKRSGHLTEYADDTSTYLRDRLEHHLGPPSHDHPRDRTADQLVRLLRNRSRQPTRNNHTPHPRTETHPTRLTDIAEKQPRP